MAQAQFHHRESDLDEQIASLLEAVEPRPEDARAPDEREPDPVEAATLAPEPVETATLAAEPVETATGALIPSEPAPAGNGARQQASVLLPPSAPPLRPQAQAKPRRVRPRRSWRLRRLLRPIRRRRGVLTFYLVGIAIALAVGWLIPTLGKA